MVPFLQLSMAVLYGTVDFMRSKQPLALVILAALFCAPLLSADFQGFARMFESSLQSEHSEALDVQLGDIASAEIPDASAADIASLRPLILKCIRGGDRTLKLVGLEVLFVISVRPDSAELMLPYDDDLIKYFDEPDEALKLFALMTLGKEYPRPSPRVLAAFQVHLADQKSTGQEFALYGSVLLSAMPENDDVVRIVLQDLAGHPQYKADADIIQVIGLANVHTPTAIDFVRKAFESVRLRPLAIAAVGRMSREARDLFVTELQRATTDLTIDESWRSAASAVLRAP